jgi:hypothetical protein
METTYWLVALPLEGRLSRGAAGAEQVLKVLNDKTAPDLSTNYKVGVRAWRRCNGGAQGKEPRFRAGVRAAALRARVRRLRALPAPRAARHGGAPAPRDAACTAAARRGVAAPRRRRRGANSLPRRPAAPKPHVSRCLRFAPSCAHSLRCLSCAWAHLTR